MTDEPPPPAAACCSVFSSGTLGTLSPTSRHLIARIHRHIITRIDWCVVESHSDKSTAYIYRCQLFPNNPCPRFSAPNAPFWGLRPR